MFLIYLSYICRSLTIADNYKYSTFFAYHNKVHLDILKMYEGCRYIFNIFNLRSFRYFSTASYTITYIIHINILQLLSYSKNYIKIRGEGPYANAKIIDTKSIIGISLFFLVVVLKPSEISVYETTIRLYYVLS